MAEPTIRSNAPSAYPADEQRGVQRRMLPPAADGGVGPTISDRTPERASPSNIAKSRSRLLKSTAAVAWLLDRGITDATMARYSIGLAEPYPANSSPDEQTADVIEAPLRHRDGTFRKQYIKVGVPGLSRNPKGSAWCAGEAQTYWSHEMSEDRTWLIVVDNPIDLWRIAQEMDGTPLGDRVMVVASTHGATVPEEWGSRTFWSRWQKVFAAHPDTAVGERHANQCVFEKARRTVFRLLVPEGMGRTWGDFFDRDGAVAALERLLGTAPPMSRVVQDLVRDETSELSVGMYASRAVNITGAWTGTHLYYPFRVRSVEERKRRVEKPDGGVVFEPFKVHRYDTKVMRSDGVVQGWVELPSPPNTPPVDRVYELDDHTEIVTPPQAREFSTWAYDSIIRFGERRRAGQSTHRSIGEIVADLRRVARSMTWLPHEPDYDLIVSYVLLSYVYQVFDAIPLVMLNGPAGSNKTGTAVNMAELSYNGFVAGEGSEKAMIRFMDAGRGLLVLDDIEALGAGRDGIGDIHQLLKRSYKKATAKKIIYDRDAGGNRVLDFYGPKVITNILGMDPVTATRTLFIRTQKMPEAVKAGGRITGLPLEEAQDLRQELHAWGMTSARAVHAAYVHRMASLGDRDMEVRAPLFAICDVVGDSDFSHSVEKALAAQSMKRLENEDPADLLKLAIQNAVYYRGVRDAIALPQIQLELGLILDPHEDGKREGPTASLRDPQWIGQTLIHLGVKSHTEPHRRHRFWTEQVRVYPLDKQWVRDALETMRVVAERDGSGLAATEEQREALSFCQSGQKGVPHPSCSACPYSTVCETSYPGLMSRKRAKGGWKPTTSTEGEVRP